MKKILTIRNKSEVLYLPTDSILFIQADGNYCFVTMPACFICGSKAELPAGYEVQANVASNTTVKVY